MNEVRFATPDLRPGAKAFTYRMQFFCVGLASSAGVGLRSPCASAAIRARYAGAQVTTGRTLDSYRPSVASRAARTEAGSAIRPGGSEALPPAASIANQN